MGINHETARLCVGPGWRMLLDEVYDALPDGAIITGVKQKYGGLRINADYINDEFFDFVCDIETRSFTVCEMCGKPGKPSGGWILTLCDECWEERRI